MSMKEVWKAVAKKVAKFDKQRVLKAHFKTGELTLFFDLNMRWAGPGGTAIPGQPVMRAEQAPWHLVPF